jgi:ABC-type glycerol-3-phosphate transport system substrate-binding protein
MKRIITIAVLLTLAALALAGCGNKQMFDTNYKFDRAIISLPNGEVITGEVQSWMDFEDGDQIQVKIDGKVYLVHSSNATLIVD